MQKPVPMRYLLLFPVLILLAANAGPKTTDLVLVWSDEFEKPGLPDVAKWSYDTDGNASGWGNNEWQHYTAGRIENAFVEDGMLHIRAIREQAENKKYSSARLITKGKGDWLYGRVEVRAKLPGTRGIWPAIWMLPTEWKYGGWPESGEIDIMEHVGYMPDSVFASVHTKSYNHVIGTQRTKGLYLTDLHENFHVYVLEWDSEQVRIFVDDNPYFSFRRESDDPNVWPFNQKFHLLLNVAVGGNWGAVKGVDSNGFPQEMIVDYVRVYQKK
ncbi:MAG: glycoside hydrolase [Bacteroidetes bacterium GWF2_49_14]|nr:MAG: glycoside hydrolase [Bacteroidetes bacterium GWF2_49_14]